MDMKEAYLKVLGLDQKPLEEKKMGRPSWVPESVTDEDVSDFMGAVAQAHKAGKDTFKFGDKSYKVTIGGDAAKKIHKNMGEGVEIDDSDSDMKDDEEDVCEICNKVHEEGKCPKSPVEEKALALEDVFSKEEIESILAKLQEKHVGTHGPDASEPELMGSNLSDGELDFVDQHEVEVVDFTPEDPEHDEVVKQATPPKAQGAGKVDIDGQKIANTKQVVSTTKAKVGK